MVALTLPSAFTPGCQARDGTHRHACGWVRDRRKESEGGAPSKRTGRREAEARGPGPGGLALARRAGAEPRRGPCG